MEKSPVSVRANSTRTVVSRCSSTTPPIYAREAPAQPESEVATRISNLTLRRAATARGRVSYAADTDAKASTAVTASTLAAVVWSWHHTHLPP